MALPEEGGVTGLPAEDEAAPERGWVALAVSDEFPGLGLAWTTVEARSGRSPRQVKERLRELSNRFHGGHAIQMRQRPIPWAYRVFFRQIGLDPDRTRTPIEELALLRMKQGAFKSRNQLDDALTIGIVETGVALRAFDADQVEGRLGIRASAPGEELEGRPGELPSGTLVIADERRPVALLFGATADGRGVHPDSGRMMLVAVLVKGVPEIAVEEALWLARAAVTI
ncbi:MAG: phenylalanine--tRNA ligase beta subunit-related protein [Solirubrobacterales bacterium]